MPPYWVLVIVTFLACNAQPFLETGVMVTSSRNLDTERYRFQEPATPIINARLLYTWALPLQLGRHDLHAVCLLAG